MKNNKKQALADVKAGVASGEAFSVMVGPTTLTIESEHHMRVALNVVLAELKEPEFKRSPYLRFQASKLRAILKDRKTLLRRVERLPKYLFNFE